MITEKIIEIETKKFMKRCYKGDVENLENKLLNYGIDLVNSPELPIKIALKERNYKTIRWLLENGADTSYVTSIRDLKLLIKCGMKPNRYHLINILKNVEDIERRNNIIYLLLENGAVPDILILDMISNDDYLFDMVSEYIEFDKKSFFIAIRLGNLKLVKLLYEANYKDICLNPQYSLNYNVRLSHDEVMNFTFTDPLLIAFHNKHYHIVNYLISKGANGDRRVLVINRKNGNVEMRRLSI